MSLIATLLHKQVPPIHHSARAFKVEEYRDKPRFQKEAELLEKAKPVYVPKNYDHMLNKKIANRKAIEDCLRNGVNTQPAIHAATGISQGTICHRLAEMVYGDELIVDRSTKPWTYQMVGNHAQA